jgi:hypothetical protein
MSRLIDYSKFDRLVDSDDEKECTTSAPVTVATSRPSHDTHHQPVPLSPSQHVFQQAKPVRVTKTGSEKGRYIFEHQGRKIYEWEQNLEGEGQ